MAALWPPRFFAASRVKALLCAVSQSDGLYTLRLFLTHSITMHVTTSSSGVDR